MYGLLFDDLRLTAATTGYFLTNAPDPDEIAPGFRHEDFEALDAPDAMPLGAHQRRAYSDPATTTHFVTAVTYCR